LDVRLIGGQLGKSCKGKKDSALFSSERLRNRINESLNHKEELNSKANLDFDSYCNLIPNENETLPYYE
jgi:hypothetical protein